MNASIPAVLLLVLLGSAWLMGRRRARPFLRSTDTSEVVALNRSQIERLQSPAPSPQAGEPSSVAPGPAASQLLAATAPGGPGGGASEFPPTGPRRQRLTQLRASLVGRREQRLQAVTLASQLPGREGLPLLRFALRDPDPLVMAAAAAAIERFRGRSAAAPLPGSQAQAWRRRPQPLNAATPSPRSVLRTR
jgi:hypothetical protein